MSSIPIQRGFRYEVSLRVSIPLAWAALLKEASKHHYDMRCNEAGHHGVINGLYNTSQGSEWPSDHPVTWSDLDLITKVAEQLEYHTNDHTLIQAIRQWLRETMDSIEVQRQACLNLPNISSSLVPRTPPEEVARQVGDAVPAAVRSAVGDADPPSNESDLLTQIADLQAELTRARELLVWFRNDYTRTLPVVASFRRWRMGHQTSDDLLDDLLGDACGKALSLGPVAPMRAIAELNDWEEATVCRVRKEPST